MPQSPAHADKAKRETINWKPGITLVADVLLADGRTPDVFPTPQGGALWDMSRPLPIPQGDKIRLNVFVATGGASLSEIKVRLDNTLIADMTTGPWSAVIDTARLTAGSHMFDVWAQATGHPPQDGGAQLVFNVRAAAPLAPGVAPPPAPVDGAPPPPGIAPGTPVDSNAKVALYYGAEDGDTPSLTVSGDTAITHANDIVVVQNPIQVKVRSLATADNTATQFVYAMVSDGTVIKTSTEPYALLSATQPTDTTIALQKQALGQQQGLPHGQYELWVWGVDGNGHPSSPEEAVLQVP